MSVRVVAHRGVRNRFPENTIPAISAALESELYGVELDLELTADSQFVCIHQETVRANAAATALAHGSRVQSQAWVHGFNVEQLRKLDAGSWFDTAFKSVRIPTFEQVLELPWGLQRGFFEIKDPYYWKGPNESYENRVCQALLPHVQHLASLGRADYVMSFNPRILAKLRRLGCKLPLFLLIWRNMRNRLADVESIVEQVQPAALGLVEELVLETPEWQTLACRQGLEVYTYAVSPAYDEPAYKSWTTEIRLPVWQALIERKVTGIISDFPLELASFINGL